MGTPVVYPQHKLRQNNGTAVVDYDTDDIRLFIVTSAYTYNVAHDFVDDLTNHVTGTNAPGTSGVSVTGKTFALDGDNAEFIHDDLTVLASAGGFANGRVAVWAKWTGVASTSPLIMRMTEASDFGNTGGDLTVDGSATTGVLNFV